MAFLPGAEVSEASRGTPVGPCCLLTGERGSVASEGAPAWLSLSGSPPGNPAALSCGSPGHSRRPPVGVQAEGPAGLPAWGWDSLHDGHPRHHRVGTDSLPCPLCIPGPQQRERRWSSPWLRRRCPVGRSALQLCSATAKELRGLRNSLSSRGRPLAMGGRTRVAQGTSGGLAQKRIIPETPTFACEEAGYSALVVGEDAVASVPLESWEPPSRTRGPE